MSDTTSDIIRSYLAENILFSGSGYPYSDDASFIEKGVVDSMNIMEIVMFVEERFQIHVDDAEIVPNHFDSISSLAAFIESKRKDSQPA